MKYREALKHVALLTPSLPFQRDIWIAIRENAGMLFFDLSQVVFRLIAVALFPITVPLFALVVVKGVRAHEKALAKLDADL